MLHVIPLEPAAGDSLIKAVRFTPGRPLTFGTWRELPVIAIGPRGGKIVGYRRGNIPIYAGSRRAKALAQTFQEVERVSKKNIPDTLTPYESQQYAILVKNWLNAQESVGGAVVLMDVKPHQSIVFPHDHGVKTDSSAADDFLASQGLVGKGPGGDVFSLKEILALMKNKPAPAPPPEEQAVMAAESASGQAAEPIFPNLSKLKEVPAGAAAGSHGNKLFVDEHGEKWLFKPKDPVISRAEIAATMIARKVLGDRIQAAKMVTIKGDEGVLLSWLKGKLIPSSDHSHPDLSTFEKPEVFSQFVQHHVVDWLISNHDGHAGNWLLREKPGVPPDLCGIDKGQAWRFFGKDKLDEDYSPNHSVPIYNKIWKAWAQKGYSDTLPPSQVYAMVAAAIDRVHQEIKPSQLAAIVGPYALAYTQKYGGEPDDLIKKMQVRLGNLRNDFSAFLGGLTGHTVELPEAAEAKALIAHQLPYMVGPGAIAYALQEPEKAPTPSPKAPPAPIAQPAPAQVAPAKEKAPPGPFQPIAKGNFKLTAQGKAPSKAAVWPKGYPGPGTVMEVIYKQKFYKVEFEEGAGGKPFITVTYPDKTNKSFYSPNAAGDSLYLWHNKLPLDMTATEKKAKKMGASAKVTLGINKFTPEELGMGPEGAASAPPAVLEDQGVVAPGAESVSLGTLLANELGSHGILTKPELIPQALKDFAQAHQWDVGATGTKPVVPPGQVVAYLGDSYSNYGGQKWWFGTPFSNVDGQWMYQVHGLGDDGAVTHHQNQGVKVFEGGLPVTVLQDWEKQFAPPGEKHEGAPSAPNWETMPQFDPGWATSVLHYSKPDLEAWLHGAGDSRMLQAKVEGESYKVATYLKSQGKWGLYLDGKFKGFRTPSEIASFAHEVKLQELHVSWTAGLMGEKEEKKKPSPDNWETMPDEDASVGWNNVAKPQPSWFSVGSLEPGSTLHFVYDNNVHFSYIHYGSGVWAIYYNGAYQGSTGTSEVATLYQGSGTGKIFLGKVEKMPAHSPALQEPAKVGTPPMPVLPDNATVPPSTSEHHPGLLADGTTISLTKSFKLAPGAPAAMDVPVTLTASGGTYELKYQIPGLTHTQTFKTLTAAALSLQAAQEGYPSLSKYIEAKGKPEKMPTWQAWGINVETEAPEAVEAELSELVPQKKAPEWTPVFELSKQQAGNLDFYQAAAPYSVVKMGFEDTPTGSVLHYLYKSGSSPKWTYFKGGESEGLLTTYQVMELVQKWQKDHPEMVVTGHAGAAVYMGEVTEIPGYAAIATTILSPEWVDNLVPGSEIWLQKHSGFKPVKVEKLNSGKWYIVGHEDLSGQDVFQKVKAEAPEKLAIFISGYKKEAPAAEPAAKPLKGSLTQYLYATPEFYDSLKVGAAISLKNEADESVVFLKKESGWQKLIDGDPASTYGSAGVADYMSSWVGMFPSSKSVVADGPEPGSNKIPPAADVVTSIEETFLEGMTQYSKVWLQTPMTTASWEKQPNGTWKLAKGTASETSATLAEHFAKFSGDQNQFGVFATGFIKGKAPTSPVTEAPPPPMPTSGKKAKANKHLSYLDPSELGFDNPAVSKWKAIAGTQAGEGKPSNWPSWMPPPGLPIEVTSGGVSAWVMALPHYGNDHVKFAMVTKDGTYLVSKAYKAASAGLALKRIFWRMKQHGIFPNDDSPDSPAYQAAFSVAKAKKLAGLDKAVWAAGETWQSVLSGSGVSGVPTVHDVAPGKDTSNATPAEKKAKIKAPWQKITILTSKVGPAEKYAYALKVKPSNKPGHMNVIMDAGPASKLKLYSLMEELGLIDKTVQTAGPSEAFGGAYYTIPLPALSEEMVLETDWVDAKSAEQGKPTPEPAGQLPLEVKAPKYDPSKFAAMKAAAAEKASKAKELHAWATQYPLVTKTSQQLALAHFQKHMKGLVPDFKMWAREAQSGHILIGSPHEETAKALGDLFEGKVPKHDTLLGPMYEVQAQELAKVAGANIGTMDGPDGKTYPAGTTFTSHDEVTTKEQALQKLITKFSPHKTDPATYKMAKVSGTGEEQKEKLTKALADVGLEAGDIKAGEAYTMAPVKIADLEKVHTKETIYEPTIPEQPPSFTPAPLPSLALKDADKDRLPAENNRGDFSSAALSSLFLGKFGHKIRMGHAGILKDCQVAVRRVRDKDGGLYYQVSGELLKFDEDKSKLQSGEVQFHTASTKVENGHHVHNYDPIEDLHDEQGENAGDIKDTSGWIGVTENGSKISVATGNRTVRNNFYVRIPVNQDVEAELHNALSKMGVDADQAMAIPTPDDERLLLKAGVLRAGLGSARWTDEYDNGKLGDEKYLDAQIKKHKLEKFLSGARIETVFGGQQTVVLDDLAEITKRVPFALRTVRQLHHVWRNITEGAGWGSRKGQVENGMWASGASDDEDWNVGGAIGTLVRGGFTHLDGEAWGNIGMHNPSAPVKVIFHPRIYQRADWWGNNSDAFGKPVPGPVGRYNRLSTSASHTNEQAFEGGISMRDVAGIVCEDTDDHEKILSELEKAGFAEVNGIPINEFVVVGPKRSRSWIAKNLKGLKPGVLP